MSNRLSMFEHVEEYLTYRRRLGYQLKVEGKLLRQFGTFVDKSGDRGVLTIDIALQWARLPEEADQLYLARRLEIVRCFARYLLITEPQTQIPPRGLLGSAHRRNTPHCHSYRAVGFHRTSDLGSLEPDLGRRGHASRNPQDTRDEVSKDAACAATHHGSRCVESLLGSAGSPCWERQRRFFRIASRTDIAILNRAKHVSQTVWFGWRYGLRPEASAFARSASHVRLPTS